MAFDFTMSSWVDWWKEWFESTESFLLGCVAVMTCLGMIASNSHPAHNVFWAFFVPALLWAVIKRNKLAYLVDIIAIRWAYALLLMCMVSAVWSFPASIDEKIRAAQKVLYTIFFMTGWAVGLTARKELKQRVAKILICAACVGVSYSIITFYMSNPISARLYGCVSLLGNPNIASPVLMGILMTCCLLLSEGTENRRAWLLTGFVFSGGFILLTQSRGPIGSFCTLAILWGCLEFGWKRTFIFFALVTVVAVVFIATSHALDASWNRRLSAGLNGRAIIWKNDILAFMNAPMLGHGSASQYVESAAGKNVMLQLNQRIPHPHGLFFSVLYYYGILGMILWIGFLLCLFRSVYGLKSRRDALHGFVFILIILMMTSTDVHSLFSSVTETWWLWWLPTIAIAVTMHCKIEKGPVSLYE